MREARIILDIDMFGDGDAPNPVITAKTLDDSISAEDKIALGKIIEALAKNRTFPKMTGIEQ